MVFCTAAQKLVQNFCALFDNHFLIFFNICCIYGNIIFETQKTKMEKCTAAQKLGPNFCALFMQPFLCSHTFLFFLFFTACQSQVTFLQK